MFIKPLHDLKVPDPVLKDFLPVEGREVQDSPYWQRRLREQEIVVAAGASQNQPPKKPKGSDQ
jgi:hypothetical protein